MRIQAEDLDLKATDNWKAVFNIVRGNEGGYFSIKTDPNTNKGILMLDKVQQTKFQRNLCYAVYCEMHLLNAGRMPLT